MTCKHIRGQAWMLNPEEGTAYISPFVAGDCRPEANDWKIVFSHCPCCGEHLSELEGTKPLTPAEATWEDDSFQPNLGTPSTCRHVIGKGYMKNPSQEGMPFIAAFMQAGAAPDAQIDWLYAFAFCPCCGEKMEDPPFKNKTIEEDDAAWAEED